MIGKLWVGLFALGVVSASSRADACVTFYENVNYGGPSMRGEDGPTAWVGNAWKDRISSLRLDPGCGVQVFDGRDFAGAAGIFMDDTPWLDEWNDKISSFNCWCG